MKLLSISTTVFAGLILSATAQALVITPENNGTTLANTILGSGITVSNVTYSGANGASGSFTGGNSSGLDIDKGIVLSSGQAVTAQGPNNNTGATTNNGFAGYAPLDVLASATTHDSTVLGFDFEFDGGAGGDLFFNFIFGSEEYLEWVNKGFNDVFGFFVDGVNTAFVPSTTTPISVDNINTTTNSSLFVDNTAGIHNTQMDGFTKAMQINLKGLSTGKHTMEFAIADTGDFILDSWIFIEADSFSNVPTNTVPEPSSLILLGLGLLSLGFARKKL